MPFSLSSITRKSVVDLASGCFLKVLAGFRGVDIAQSDEIRASRCQIAHFTGSFTADADAGQIDTLVGSPCSTGNDCEQAAPK